jgi:NDP-sugar pyrophosphorylase family protein
MNALLLAAGLGKRMKPITDTIPKPLLRIVDQRLIDINIKHLLKSGIERIGINLFHKHELINEHLKTHHDNVYTIREDELKGTGGALCNFKDFLSNDFIMQSGDVVSDIRLKEIIDFHKEHKPVATLVLTKYQGIKFQISKDNRIEKMCRGDTSEHTYSGIGIFSERVFSFLPEKSTFSIVDVFQNILDSKELLIGLPSVMNWYNINSHYTYWKIHHDLLLKDIEFEGLKFGSPIHIAPSSKVETDKFKGFVSISENCTVLKNVRLENTIVLPNSHIKSGNFRNCVLSDRFCITVA